MKEKIKTLREGKEVKKLIKLFADKTGCNTQYNNCPCNTCFHSLNDKIDFKHIVWAILLGLRGDYSSEDILKDIKEELNLK